MNLVLIALFAITVFAEESKESAVPPRIIPPNEQLAYIQTRMVAAEAGQRARSIEDHMRYLCGQHGKDISIAADGIVTCPDKDSPSKK